MKKLLAMTLVTGLLSVGSPSSANAAYLFGISPTGSQTLTINGDTVLQANQMGWFDSHGEHIAGNSNYYITNEEYGSYRNFFGFDLSNFNGIVTSAVLDIGNEPDGGFLGIPVIWRLFDVAEAIDSSENYLDTGIWSDLGTGISYGEVNVTAPISNVSLVLNSNGLNALNRSVGQSFFIGGALASATPAVPEPATWFMMIIGFASIGGVLRRKMHYKTRIPMNDKMKLAV
jgi:PEP-CTERM motif